MAYATKPREVLDYELSLEPYHKSPLAVARHLATHYRFRDVAGDGNCLFRALSVGLYGHENEHAALRKQAFEYLQAHPDVLSNNRRGAAILATSKQPGVWGEHPHILAIAAVHNARVVQLSVRTGQWFVSGEPEPSVPPKPIVPLERVVWLRYVDDAHYGGYAYVGAIDGVDVRRPSPPRAASTWHNSKSWSFGDDGSDGWRDPEFVLPSRKPMFAISVSAEPSSSSTSTQATRHLKTPKDFLTALREMRAEMEDHYDGLGM
jgi:hypothetical protein